MKTVKIFIITTAVIWLAAEFIFILLGKPTISQGIWNMNEVSAAVPFGSGLLCGHFFWSKKS